MVTPVPSQTCVYCYQIVNMLQRRESGWKKGFGAYAMRMCGDLLAGMRCCTLAAILLLVLPCFATAKVRPNAVGGTDPKPKKSATGTANTTVEAVIVVETLLSLLGL